MDLYDTYQFIAERDGIFLNETSIVQRFSTFFIMYDYHFENRIYSHVAQDFIHRFEDLPEGIRRVSQIRHNGESIVINSKTDDRLPVNDNWKPMSFVFAQEMIDSRYKLDNYIYHQMKKMTSIPLSLFRDISTSQIAYHICDIIRSALRFDHIRLSLDEWSIPEIVSLFLCIRRSPLIVKAAEKHQETIHLVVMHPYRAYLEEYYFVPDVQSKGQRLERQRNAHNNPMYGMVFNQTMVELAREELTALGYDDQLVMR